MSNSIQPPPPPIPVPPTPAPATTTVTIPALPDVLAQLPKGAVLDAQVMYGQGDGVVRLAVTTGDTTLNVDAKLPLPLPSGSTLSMRVQQATQTGDVAHLRLTAVNGKPVAGALADLAQATTGAKALQGAGQTATVGAGATGNAAASANLGGVSATSTIGVGKPISAMVLRSDLMQDPQGQKFLASGTRLSVRLTQITMPNVGSGGAATANAGSGFASATAQGGAGATGIVQGQGGASVATGVTTAEQSPMVPGQAAAKYAAMGKISPAMTLGQGASAGTPQAGVAAGGVASGGVAATQSGAAAAPQTASSGTPQATPVSGTTAPGVGGMPTALAVMTGKVVSLSAVGQPTVQVGSATIALDVRAPLPTGTQVTFDVLSATPPQPGAAAPTAGGYVIGPPNPWTTLDALWQSVGQANPQAAARLAAVLPQAGPHLMANMAAAISAVRSGDIQGWLRTQETTDTSKLDEKTAGRIKKLADRLSDDVREAGQSARRPMGEWRGYSLPMLVGGEIERIQMLVRRAPERDDEEHNQAERKKKKASDVRFLLDLTLSRLGDMQLDGLVNTQSKKLDLVIRTRDDLPRTLPRNMLGVFSNALSAVGYTGSLAFRVTSQFIVPEDVIETGTTHSSGVEV